jgi:peptidoglycan hydrolase-like protein with peptidoglycan-binding domain
MESPGAHKRSSLLAPAAAFALLSLLALAFTLSRAGSALASSTVAGGTAPPTPASGSTPASGTTTAGGATPAGGKSTPATTHTKAPAAKTTSASAAKIAGARCVPVVSCGTKQHVVSTHGTLLMQGTGLKSGETVAFPRSWHARLASNSPSGHLHTSKLGLVVTVPANAHSGYIEVRLAGGRHSNAYGPISVVTYRLHPPAPPAPAVPPTSTATTASGTAFAGQGMWIWYMSASDCGNVASIVAQAHAADVSTLYIKSSDGSSNYWSQFSAQLVAELHAAGLKACAWQYVYGTNPTGEADLGAEAVANGADCLVIDAESQYEGHYAAAQTYIETLRAKIGPSYPVGLASFPYVSYHPSFPYSVFLGPGGAQFNAPQMYWHDIGTSVAQVFVTTFEQNLIYGRPILPLGQTYGGASASEIANFRTLAGAYGAAGDSFWDWQETSSSGWSAMVAPPNTALTVPQPELTSPLLREGSKSDQVLWLQEHLAGAIPTQPTTGIFESQTATDVKQIQAEHGLPATGETDAATWGYILALPMVEVNWTAAGPKT